jgi:hypothetical protein
MRHHYTVRDKQGKVRPSYKEMAYHVLFNEGGGPMDIRDIVHKCRHLLRVAGDAQLASDMGERVWNTFAAKINNEIQNATEGTPSRFKRVGANQFELVSTNAYDGNFKRFLEDAKEERRREAVEAGEITDNPSSPPKKSPTLKLTTTTSAQCTLEPKKRPAQLTNGEEKAVQALMDVVEARVGFEEALIVATACRSGDLNQAKSAIQRVLMLVCSLT